MSQIEQEALFAAPVEPIPAALPYTPGDLGAAASVLVGDGYRWLAAILPPPSAVHCDAHRVRMRLDPVAGLLLVCPRCSAETIADASRDVGGVAA